MTYPTVSIVKESGESAPFAPEKLFTSLEKCGASHPLCEKIVRAVESKVRPGTSTSEIHRKSLRILSRQDLSAADRYHLRRSLHELGPTGFPFERLIAALLRRFGYECRVGQVVPGRCVSHEVDVVAVGPKRSAWVECKFHNLMATRSDVKTALYCYARALDLQSGPRAVPKRRFWVATNTKFTSEAVQYAECMGLGLLGWNYPPRRSLHYWMEQAGIYPLTCLTGLKVGQKRRLIDRGLILAEDLLTAAPKRIRGASGLTDGQFSAIEHEIRLLGQTHEPIGDPLDGEFS